MGISPDPQDTDVHIVAVFNRDHSHATIYHGETQTDLYMQGNSLLTLFPQTRSPAGSLADRVLPPQRGDSENKELLFVNSVRKINHTAC
jgi:hypothetical protein